MNLKYKFELTNNAYTKVLLIFILSRLLYIFQYVFISKLINQPTIPSMGVFLHWDSKLYLDIINNGYLATAEFPIKYPFFPFYPMFIKLVSTILHINPVITGLIVNQIAFLASLIVLYKYATSFLSLNQIHIEFSIFLLAISSVNIYFNILYTESIFILLVLLAFYNLRANNYWLCAIIACIMGMTKVNGILFMIPFVMHSYQYHKKLIRWQLILQLGIISLGLLSFMLYLFKTTGDPLAFVHLQSHWGRLDNVDWFHHPIISLVHVFQSARPHELLFFIISIIIIVFLLIKKVFYLENSFFSASLMLPVLSGKLDSYTRYMLVHFIVYIALGYITDCKSRLWSYFTILFFSIFSFGLLVYFIEAT